MKGHSLPGIKQAGSNKTGGRAKSSALQMKDLSGDGKITQKDVLIGRGVIKKDSPVKKYKSDAQRKAVHASKADKASPAKKYGKSPMEKRGPDGGSKGKSSYQLKLEEKRKNNKGKIKLNLKPSKKTKATITKIKDTAKAVVNRLRGKRAKNLTLTPSDKLTIKKGNTTSLTNPTETKLKMSTGGGSFNQAFARARKAGKETFTWKGKPYNTKLKK